MNIMVMTSRLQDNKLKQYKMSSQIKGREDALKS